MTTLQFQPLIPSSLWMTLVVLLGGMFVWYGLGRPAGFVRARWYAALGLMVIGAVAVLTVLLNPTWVVAIPPPAGKPLLTLAVDTSESMATRDAANGATRIVEAIQTAEALKRGLADQFDVRTMTFDSTIVPTDIAALHDRSATGQLTDLGQAIRNSLDTDRPQGQAVIIISDGIHNAGGTGRDVLAAVRYAKALAAPIFTKVVGGQESIRDLSLEFQSAQELAATGQTVPIVVRVRQRGLAGGVATVRLRHEGIELAAQQVALNDTPVEVRFDVKQEEADLYRYEVEVDPAAAEATDANNRGAFLLRVVDEPIRLLLLEGKPYWDTKFLVRTLAFDPAVELHSVVRLTDTRLMERTLRLAEPTDSETDAAPTRREDWRIISDPREVLGDESLGSVQVLILGRAAESFLTDEAIESIRTWIARDGGSLLCYRGSPVAQVGQRLDSLLPVRWSPTRESRFRVRMTRHGRQMRWLPFAGPAGSEYFSSGSQDSLSYLPTLSTGTRVEARTASGFTVVLAQSVTSDTGEDFPVLSYQPYGTGRVVAIEGSGMWRWAFLAPTYEEHDEIYRALWHSLLRWLASSPGLLPGQDVALRTDKVRFRTDETATATLLMREEPAAGETPFVELIGSSLSEPVRISPEPIGDEPGAWRVAFGQLPVGNYQARIVRAGDGADAVTARTAFDVHDSVQEKLDLKSRPDLMARIAFESGGAVLGDDPDDDVVSHFREHMAQVRPPRVNRATAWDRWWVLVAIFVTWGSAWMLRRSGGLV